jgi:hypothetical protein
MVVHASEDQSKAERERLTALYRATMSGHLTADEHTEMLALQDKQRGRERSTLLSSAERLVG